MISIHRAILSLVALAALQPLALYAAPGVSVSVDADSKLQVLTIQQGKLEAKLAPGAGANVFSIKFDGVQILKTPASLKELPGFVYGVPVLYPSPNRVRDSVFEFEGQKYKFEPNNDANFLHGLVHSSDWQVESVDIGSPTTIKLALPFEAKHKEFERFPFKHDLKLAIRVDDHSVRWTYTVDNSHGDKNVPFGFALHPWFLYQGSRADTFLTILATNLMESEKLLPTGKLLDLDGTKFDLRKPKSLADFYVDDVYFGMTPQKPTTIDFRKPGLKITLSASEDFTNLVLYTPKDQPWFCVENQSCSTDAHNMYAKGFKRESHLQIVPPGKTATGYIEYKFTGGSRE